MRGSRFWLQPPFRRLCEMSAPSWEAALKGGCSQNWPPRTTALGPEYSPSFASISLCRLLGACHHKKVGSGMQKAYVTEFEGAQRVVGRRVSLDSLIYLFREGVSAEGMVH